MFIGHYAVGLAAKRAVPEASLGTLFLAGQLADLIWPTLLLVGVERVEIQPGNTVLTPLAFVHYPYSHSLVALGLWSIVLGAIVARAHRRPWQVGLVVVGVAVSHWVLDAVVHRPDLPLTFSGTARIGLGLWNVPWATFTVEGVLVVTGLALYVRSTRARDRAGRIGLWSLLAFLVVVYVGNVFGPPPPSVTAIALAGQALWLIVVWAYWVDRHRTTVP